MLLLTNETDDIMMTFYKKIRFALIAVLLIAVSLVSSERQARAQFLVTDIPQTVAATLDAASQLAATLESLGLNEENFERMKQWKEKIEGWKEDIDEAIEFIAQVNEVALLIQQLNTQLQFTTYMIEAVNASAQSNFDQYYILNLLTYINSTLQSLDSIFNTIEILKTKTGLDLADRKKLIDEEIIRGYARIDECKAFVNDELAFMQELKEIVALSNFSMNREPESGLDCYGTEKSYQVKTYSSKEDAVLPSPTGDFIKGEGMGSTYGTFFRIVLIIIGIICAFALVFAMVRYMQGTAGAEMMFVRIFAIAIIVTVAFMIIYRIALV